jgi:hypothetical protein
LTVVGPITIDLSGIAGDSGANGNSSSEIDGKPGDAGANGGSFFILACDRHGLSDLTVNVSGGNGGKGGDGGRGGDGEKGDDGDLDSYDVVGRDRKPQRIYNGRGKDGTPGSNGGRGGRGGKKVLAGQVNIQADLKLITEGGQPGGSGAVGKGGKGGRHGKHCKGTCYVGAIQWLDPLGYGGERGRASSGLAGVGVSDVKGAEPIPLRIINFESVFQNYIEYRNSKAADPAVAPFIKVFPNLNPLFGPK